MYRFDEMWMGECQTARLAELARSTSSLVGEVVEIGTWQGWSAIPIARAIAPAQLHVVDHWLGDGAAIPPELVARDNYGIFMANVEEARAADPGVNIYVHKMGWREWIAGWSHPIRFLHLDAAHTTVEVADNIAAVLPYMVPGGILAGDDWDHPLVEAGIRQVLPMFDAHVLAGEAGVQWSKLWWVRT